MYKIKIIVVLLAFTNICCSQNCNQLDIGKGDCEIVIKQVRQSSFNISEEVNTSKSSWIKKLEYYSCDKEVGYLILSTKRGKVYLFKDLPIILWRDFKQAESFGSFYNEYIKGRYSL